MQPCIHAHSPQHEDHGEHDEVGALLRLGLLCVSRHLLQLQVTQRQLQCVNTAVQHPHWASRARRQSTRCVRREPVCEASACILRSRARRCRANEVESGPPPVAAHPEAKMDWTSLEARGSAGKRARCRPCPTLYGAAERGGRRGSNRGTTSNYTQAKIAPLCRRGDTKTGQ